MGAASILTPIPDLGVKAGVSYLARNGSEVSVFDAYQGHISGFATGGDLFLLKLNSVQARPVNLTPHLPVSVTAVAWSCDGAGLLTSQIAADQRRLVVVPAVAGGKPVVLASTQESLDAGDVPVASACEAAQAAVVHESFTVAPEIEVGAPGKWHDLTHANRGLTAPVIVTNVTWTNNSMNDQGWLLLPVDTANDSKRPMITLVHGGPAAANGPEFAGNPVLESLMGAGYAVFLPNPRGSFGQGEAFTLANVRDLGHGDLRDIEAGITATERVAPIDESRLGLAGWSYGGFMSMFAVTQTNRFKAVVAGAGISNWQSYYGENGIDRWMIPYFGASVYDDPAIYARSSAITYIKKARTPTLSVVGERDIECPAPQTMEFWHALNALGITTEAVIYPGEGHHMRDPANIARFSQAVRGVVC